MRKQTLQTLSLVALKCIVSVVALKTDHDHLLAFFDKIAGAKQVVNSYLG